MFIAKYIYQYEYMQVPLTLFTLHACIYMYTNNMYRHLMFKHTFLLITESSFIPSYMYTLHNGQNRKWKLQVLTLDVQT